MFLRERNSERKRAMSSFPASSADDFSGKSAADSDLSVDHGSTVTEAHGFKGPNPSYSHPSFESIHVENENDNKNGDIPVDHASAVPETYGSEDSNPSFSQFSYEPIHVEKNDKGYGGFGENDVSGDGVFVSDGTVLPLTTEMKSKEFFTLQEWRRPNAIQLEKKEKTRRETRKGKEAEPYLQAFYEERKVDVESSKANNSEWEKALQGDERELEASSWLHELRSQYERQGLSAWMAEVVKMLRKGSEMLEQENLWCLLLEKEIDCLEQDVDIKDLKEPIVSLSGLVRRLQNQKAELVHSDNSQLVLANQEQSNRDADKDFWKSILDLISYGKPIDLSRMYQILVKLSGSPILEEYSRSILEDILMQIFLRLPVTSLIRFLTFSKDCHKMISSTYFIKQQQKLAIESNADVKLFMEDLVGKVYSVEFSVTQDTYLPKQIAFPFSSEDHVLNFQGYLPHIRGCCHGLLCIIVHFDGSSDKVVILNPHIRKYKTIFSEQSQYSMTTRLAFGYYPHEDDYVVLKMNSQLKAMRYSLKSDSWKEINFSMEERALIRFSYDSVAINMNGAFHWLTWLPNKVSILIFNLISEKLMLFDIPVQPSKEQRRGTHLQVLNGELCFSLNSRYSVDIWGLMEYGKSNSWYKIYGLNFAEINPQPLAIYRPLLVSKDGRQLLLEESIGLKTKLLWYDLEAGSARWVRFESLPEGYITTVSIGTLLLLDRNDGIHTM